VENGNVNTMEDLTVGQVLSAGIAPENAQEPTVCEAVSEIAPPNQERGANGQFMVGNSAARRHGLYSQQLQEDAAPWRAEQMAAIRADLGEDVSTLKAHTVEQLGTVLVILRFLGGNLMAEGPLTGKGKSRAATTTYLQTVDRYMRLASMLGLERKAKPVASLEDVLNG
jgi:hypothetical protein